MGHENIIYVIMQFYDLYEIMKNIACREILLKHFVIEFYEFSTVVKVRKYGLYTFFKSPKQINQIQHTNLNLEKTIQCYKN